jgi:hypothetical protein
MNAMRARALFCLLLIALPLFAADHNDPNSVNSIFSDVNVSAADLYDMFGWPINDGKSVVLALTFASVPSTGVFDNDMLYRIMVDPDPRVGTTAKEVSLRGILQWADAVAKKYTQGHASEIRVTVDTANQAHIDFMNFPSGSFSKVLATNTVHELDTPDGQKVKVYIGGRDDAFFNDLPGFFRSINYAPQFYHVPLTARRELREMHIPKTLLELEGNTLFNFDPAKPTHGSGLKLDLPPGPYAFKPTAYKKDANGNYRFVYSGKDAQAGRNINAIIVEMPLTFVTKTPETERIVNAWGESWVLKASSKIETISDNKRVRGADEELARYKRVDTDGIPFSDAGLAEREDKRQLGANNITLARTFVRRFGHLGWGFAPSVTALGLPTCFKHGDTKVSRWATYRTASAAFPRVAKCFFQDFQMPDDSWNPKHLPIKLRKPFEVFIPNVNSIDMDTTGTWPFGRRPEDQVATRFLSAFLDHSAMCGRARCNVESLSDQAIWDAAPVEPKTPPNPLHNDKPFLTTFPYLAEPW